MCASHARPAHLPPQGGIKTFFKLLKLHNLDSQVCALSASVLSRCCAVSNVTLMTLAKEKVGRGGLSVPDTIHPSGGC